MTIHAVAEAIRKSHRMVVLNHPASMNCKISRRVVKRDSLTGAAPGTEYGGLPPLGGLPILADDDEADVDFEPIESPDQEWPAKLMFTTPYPGAPMFDNQASADIGANLVEATIEPKAEEGQPGWFEPLSKGDLVFVSPVGTGAVFTFVVQEVPNTAWLTPYRPKYQLASQGDMTYIAGIPVEPQT